MDGFSRKKTATSMKRKLLTMLLVFTVVATYIPFDRAFAANESGKKQDKQVEKKVNKAAGKQADKKPDADAGKAVDKPQPETKQADKPKGEAGKDAGKDASNESAALKAKAKDAKAQTLDKATQAPRTKSSLKSGGGYSNKPQAA